MRYFKSPLLSLAFLLILVISPFSSKAATEVDDNEAYSYIQQYLEAFKNGNFVIGTTTPAGVKSIVGPYVTETESMITYKRSFTGYSFTAEWAFTDGTLSYFTIDTFYDEDKHSQAQQDGNEVRNLMKNIYGEPIESSDSEEAVYSDWEVGELFISFDLFDDGYSIFVDPLLDLDFGYDDIEPTTDDILCVGDFANLKMDLLNVFITNIKNGSIKIGKTTKSDMQSLTGDGELYDKDYDGLWVMGSYSYDENGRLTDITLDYFYDCSGALILLDADKLEITEMINDAIGSTGVKETGYEEPSTFWSVNGQNLSQESYDDGFAIILE